MGKYRGVYRGEPTSNFLSIFRIASTNALEWNNFPWVSHCLIAHKYRYPILTVRRHFFPLNINSCTVYFPNLTGTASVTSEHNKGLFDQGLIKKLILKKLIIFNCGFSTETTCAFLLQEQIYELNTFKPIKTTISSPVLIR